MSREKTRTPHPGRREFLEASLNFVIVGFVMFLVVRAYNRLQEANADPQPDAEPPAEPEDVVLLRRIARAVERN